MKVNGHDQSTRAYVGAFNFKGQDQQKNVGKLSGGERNRVNIAKMLKRGGNVLLLDEPTNDLDVETLGALEEAIENFAGCAVVISHDRFFLDRLATHILAFEGDSQVEWFEGNFQAYEEDKVRRLGEEATRPHRTSYRQVDAIAPCDHRHRAACESGEAKKAARTFCFRRESDELKAQAALCDAGLDRSGSKHLDDVTWRRPCSR